MSQQLTIRKFTVELQTQTMALGQAAQQQCLALVKNRLLQQIERIINQAFDADAEIRIGKLEIDLGNFSSETIEAEFVERYTAAFEKNILSLKDELANKTNKSSLIEQVNSDTEMILQFIAFLQTGQLNTKVSTHPATHWQAQALQSIQQQPDFFLQEFQKLLADHSIGLQRLIHQFDPPFLASLAQIGLSISETSLMQIWNQYSQQLPASSKEKFKSFFWKYLFWRLINKNDSAEQVRTALMDESTVAKELETVLVAALQSLSALLGEAHPAKNLPQLEKANLPMAADKKEQSQKADAVFVENAGLVLLHPFLKNCFEALDWLDNNKFKEAYCQQKAIHLLQYMATGMDQEPEFLLPLNQLLCGHPSGKPMDRFIQLSQIEKQEADNLLAAVLSHWSALKNTSVEALRETFLQRRAKLTHVAADHFWKLQVERKAVDILLDKIPWGYSYVQLPWMEKPLIVEW
jgi:hypothetical protein